jgi:hypothetical protein
MDISLVSDFLQKLRMHSEKNTDHCGNFSTLLGAQTTETEKKPGEKSLTTIYTSDLQRHIFAENEEGFVIADVSAVVDYVNRRGSSLVLNTGSLSPVSSEVDLRSKYPGFYVQILEEIGYDAFVPSAHDFADGLAPLVNFDEETNFPTLSAYISADGKSPFESSIVFDVNGIKVGVFSLVSPEVEEMLSQKQRDSSAAGDSLELDVQDVLQTAEREVERLENSGAEVIVAVTDIALVDLYDRGYFSDSELNRVGTALSGHIDLVIEGSKTSTGEEPFRLGTTVFTGAAGSGQIGGVDILVRDGEVAEIRTRMFGHDAIEEAGLEPMPEVVSLVARLSVAMAIEDSEKTAQITETDTGKEKVAQPEGKERTDEIQEEDTDDEVSQPTEQRTLPQLELFLEPGLSLYSGAVGYGGSIGVMISLDELFGLGSPLDDMVLGLLMRCEELRTTSPDLKLNAWGPALFGGYRIILDDYFPEIGFFTGSRLLLRLTAGAMSLKIERNGENTYSKFSPLLEPGLVIDKELPFLNGLRAGITGEYSMTFADSVLGNFRIGAFASWTY